MNIELNQSYKNRHTENCEKLNQLKLADDIALIANDTEESQELVLDLNNTSKQITQRINRTKSKYVTKELLDSSNKTTVYNMNIEKVQSYIYQGHRMNHLSKRNLKDYLDRRYSLTWATFGRWQTVFKSTIPHFESKNFRPKHIARVNTWNRNVYL